MFPSFSPFSKHSDQTNEKAVLPLAQQSERMKTERLSSIGRPLTWSLIFEIFAERNCWQWSAPLII